MSTATQKFGPLIIHWYGVIIACALLVGLLISVLMARLRRQRADPLAGILLLGVLAGAIGGRVWYFALRKDYYNPDPGRVFAVWQGGMGLDGAILGGLLATLIYTWSRELDFWLWADICAPGLILGQAIGRIGDLVNNQAFGRPMSGTWTVVIPPENRPPQYLGYTHFTPTAAYEGLWDLAVFVVLVALTLLQTRRWRIFPTGCVFLAYLILYSAGRIPIEGLRVDSLWIANMRAAQVAGWVMLAAGVVLYVARLLPRREAAPAPPPVRHGQPSEAYLAAIRDMPLPDPRTAPLQLEASAGNGHLPATAEMPPLSEPITAKLSPLTPGTPGQGSAPPGASA